VIYLFVCVRRSDVTVVVLGEKGVGKTTFIENCFVSQSHCIKDLCTDSETSRML
jgi:septin family protein